MTSPTILTEPTAPSPDLPAPSGRLVLVDGHAVAYRAFFALQRMGLATRDGRPTWAVYGFTRALLDVLAKTSPDLMAVSFDRKAPTFRNELSDTYKAHRKPMPDDLVAQMEPIKEVVRAFGLPIYELDGYEADDLIGTIARSAAARGHEVRILTGDRDSFQLVDDLVHVLWMKSGSELVEVDPERVALEFDGLTPRQIIDYKGLAGDASDNISGVPGIGDKTAKKLLLEHGSVEALYEHLDSVSNAKLREKLATHREDAFRSLKLATIDVEVPIESLDWEHCALTPPDLGRLRAVLEDLQFHSIVRDLPRIMSHFRSGPAASSAPETTAVVVETPPAIAPWIVTSTDDLGRLVQELGQVERFAFDTETEGLEALDTPLVGLAFAYALGDDARAVYVPVGHRTGEQLPREQVLAALRPILEDPARSKVAHHAKFDLHVLHAHGIDVQGLTLDTMLLDYLRDPASPHGLKDLATRLLNLPMAPITDLIGKGAKAVTLADIDIGRAAEYAALDAHATRLLVDPLVAEVEASGLMALYREVELPLVGVLAAMEREGIRVDRAYLGELSRIFGDRLVELESSIHDLAGSSFNINSPKQLATVLFETLGLPVLKRTPKKEPSTDASVLEELAPQHPIVAHILEYRQLTKLKSTYVDALPELIDTRTGKLHTSFNQMVAATGRLSSERPNLQNIPIRTAEGSEIRRAFVPSGPDRVLLSADYSQIELRLLAHVSEEPAFVEAFQADQDIHARTASELFGVPLEQVSSDQRRMAKTVNFATLYGQGPFSLSKVLGIPMGEAKSFIDRFWARYPRIRAYTIEAVEQATERGYAITLMGRRRYLPELKERRTRDMGERLAVNSPIQGSAADIIKVAMIRLDAALRNSGSQARMILQVHDELVLDVPVAELETVSGLVRESMESAFPLNVPLKVEMASGTSWKEAK
jgi:DNA polymerase-1